MANPKRTQTDIKQINIYMNPVGHNGWLVDILYLDGKMAEFQIDHFKDGQGDMLQVTVDCIKKQLVGSG